MPDPMAPDGGLMLQWFLGGAVVVFYALHRFKDPRLDPRKDPRPDPRPARATTTGWRYWSACTGYLVAMLLIFIVLGGGITEINPGVLLAVLGVDKLPQEAGTLPGPLLSALLLTSLLPHFPTLGRIDEEVRRKFQRIGNIPYAVRVLSGYLLNVRYLPSPQSLDPIAMELKRRGVDLSWLRDPPDSIKYKWARSVALYAHVRNWESAPGFMRYVEQFPGALKEIDTRIGSLAGFLDERTLTELDRDTSSRLAAHGREKIGADLDAVHLLLLDFISGGVLNGSWNQERRDLALERLGFADLSPRGPLTSHDLVLVAGLIFLAMLFIPLMTRRFFDPVPLSQSIRILVMVPIIYAIAIVAAVYPKSMWTLAPPQRLAERPVADYAVSGAVPACAAFAVSLVFRYVFEGTGNLFQTLSTPGAFLHAWNMTVERWPWLLMTFFITVAIAWAADDSDRLTENARRRLRLVEAASLAVVFGGLQWAVLQLLSSMPSAAAPQMMATAMIIGACIGWFVPHMHRSRRGLAGESSVVGVLVPAV